MPGRIVRTKTAERVSELLGSREGRRHLSEFGWVQGMPIVMTVSTESVNDVMGLVSMHGRPVLVAMIEPVSDELKFLYVAMPNPALETVACEKDSELISNLFQRAELNGLVTFRSKYWESSTVTHPIPTFRGAPVTRAYAQRFGN